VTPLHAVLGALVMTAGAALQASIGFGSNLVAAPLLLLIDDRYVPGPVIVASLAINILVSRREGPKAIHAGLRPALVGQVFGVVGATVVLSLLSADALSLAFGALVLVAVGLSAAGWHLRPTLRATLARFFLVGGCLSIVAVAIAGKLGSEHVVPILTLLPGVAVGYLVAGRFMHHVAGRAIRPIVLTLSAISAVAVLVKELV
jgi:uncharacterized membrane protein YfcA